MQQHQLNQFCRWGLGLRGGTGEILNFGKELPSPTTARPQRMEIKEEAAMGVKWEGEDPHFPLNSRAQEAGSVALPHMTAFNPWGIFWELQEQHWALIVFIRQLLQQNLPKTALHAACEWRYLQDELPRLWHWRTQSRAMAEVWDGHKHSHLCQSHHWSAVHWYLYFIPELILYLAHAADKITDKESPTPVLPPPAAKLIWRSSSQSKFYLP